MSDYAHHEHHDFAGAVRQALVDAPLQAALARLTGTLLSANRRGYSALRDSDKLRDHAKHIKEHTLANLHSKVRWWSAISGTLISQANAPVHDVRSASIFPI